jgi:hypothetical protein
VAQISMMHKIKKMFVLLNQNPRQKQHKVNMCIIITEIGKWTIEMFKEAMDVIKNGRTSLKQANIHWNIPCTSLSNHLNGRTRSRKCGLASVLKNK